MFLNLPAYAIIAIVAGVLLVVMFATGVFSLRKQYRNKDRFSPEGAIQKNLAELNAYQLDDSATNKFHYDNRITKDILDDGMRLDDDYIKRQKKGPYGFATSSSISKEDKVLSKAKDVDPSVKVQVSINQVKPGKKVAVKKESVIQGENVIVKAEDVVPGEKVIVKPSQVKPNQKVLKRSAISGENVLVNKADVSLDEDVMADVSQIEPAEPVVVKASQVKSGKTVVVPKESTVASGVVMAAAEDLIPDENVLVERKDIGTQAAAGIEIEAPPPVSIGSVEEYRLGGDSRFGKMYALNKTASRKAYSTLGTRQKLSEFPLNTGVHVSRII
jgi:hypothetical protein